MTKGYVHALCRQGRHAECQRIKEAARAKIQRTGFRPWYPECWCECHPDEWKGRP
jgi:hypothetical protein